MTYTDTIVSRRRLGGLVAVVGLATVVLLGRLVQLQLFDHSVYLAQATRTQSRKYEVPPERGQIYALDGDSTSPLVLNQTLATLYADPRYVTNKAAVAAKLASVTGQSAATYTKLLGGGGEYVVLAKKLDQATSDKIKKLNLAGVGLSDANYRLYPEGTLASQLLGFVNDSGVGQYGIEGYLNKELAGTPGTLKATTDANGIPIATANNYSKAPVNGQSVVLTIDRNIQAQAEKYIAQGVQSNGAVSGSVVVVDPNTGAVKAMANYPTYDPSNYGSVTNYSLFQNAVVADAFEPGSGFKMFTMAAGLDTGKVTPDTTYTDTGSFTVDGYVVKNAEGKSYGVSSMSKVILFSLNTGAMFVLRMLGGDPNVINHAGKQLLYSYITAHFGFGAKTGIEQAYESAGKVNPPTSSDVNYANMTFGQGVSVTMLQMAMAAAAIANGGKLYKPYLVDKVISPDGKTTVTKPTLVRDHVISPQAATQLTTMLQSVVTSGTGRATNLPGYQVAGKTGTAQIPNPTGPGYLATKNIGSFTGYAPVADPQFVMMVRINEPTTPGFAESTTVPVFAQIAQWLLRYYAVPPTGQ